MRMLDRLFGSKTTSNPDSKPEKPTPKRKTRETEIPVFDVTFEYQNGDTETLRCTHLEYQSNAVVAELVDDITTGMYRPEPYGERRTIPFETLSRPPQDEEVGKWVITYTYVKDYRWKSYSEKWEEKTYPDIEDLEYELQID